MKQYPSIPRSGGTSFRDLGKVHVFDKLDGSNLRFEYSKKRGWYKFGSRTQLIDETSPFGGAIDLFKETLAEQIIECLRKSPDKVVVFCEYWGEDSFAGNHNFTKPMNLTLFDVCIDNKGFMPPKEFVKTFSKWVPTPDYLGVHNWTRGFVDRVRAGEVEGVTFEGVVGKTLIDNRLIMAKAKTQAWFDKVRNTLPAKEAEMLINS